MCRPTFLHALSRASTKPRIRLHLVSSTMASTTSSCSYCGNPPEPETALQRCGGCKFESYCSTECQRRDWLSGHKQQCKLISLQKKAEATAAGCTSDTVKGVRLTCTKESGGFWEVDIPSNHSMFDGPLLEVPAILGVPLVIHRVGTQSNNRADLDCQIATFLNITYRDGMAPPEWQSHVGSCLVARKDKKPLSSQHLEAVWMYIDRILDYFGEEGPREAQKLITRKDFEKWLENYKLREASNGRSEWADVGSLYDL